MMERAGRRLSVGPDRPLAVHRHRVSADEASSLAAAVADARAATATT
jgi:hypothetical protein